MGRRRGWGVGTAWGHAGPGQPELTVEEAGLRSGVAFGVAVPSPAQLLAVEEVPEPGARVQAVPAGREVCAQPRPRPRPRPHPRAARLCRRLVCAYCLPCSVLRPRGRRGQAPPSPRPIGGDVSGGIHRRDSEGEGFIPQKGWRS